MRTEILRSALRTALILLVFYLLQVIHGGLWQVLIPGLFYLFPQLLICLSKYCHCHQQQSYQKTYFLIIHKRNL